MILFVVYPLINLIYLSFVSWDGIHSVKNFVGIYNFRKFFTDGGVALSSLKNNALYFFFHLIFIPIEIFLAYQLDKGLRNGNFYKILILVPYIVNGVAVSYMFSSVFSPMIGAVDMTFKVLGIESSIRWLSDPAIVNFVLVAVSIWRFSGFHIILFYVALQSISRELYDAAKIDGAGEMNQFRYIVIPGIILVIELVLFMNMRGAMQQFDIPFVMTGGGPGFASTTFTLHTLNTAFLYNDYGLASAMAVLLIIMIIGFSKIQDMIVKTRVH
jgi:multiple sugar transport system permease protein